MLSGGEINEIVKESYDLHLHVGPDIMPREFNVGQVLREEKEKIKGVVVKSHAFSTVPAIESMRKKPERFSLVGSVTLNNFVGGINEDVVYASATASENPIFVWFPTTHAKNMFKQGTSEYEIPRVWIGDSNFNGRLKKNLNPIYILNEDGELDGRTIKVLKMIKKMDCVLATGHVSWEESEKLASKALEMGIKVIVTHPISRHIDMPIEVQKSLAKKGAFIEHCYIMYKDGKYDIGEIAKQIKAVGSEHCIISSDAGQLKNPGPSESLKKFIELLSQNGIKEGEFKQMLVKNPRDILQID